MRELIKAILKMLGLSTRREVEHFTRRAAERDQELTTLRASLKSAREQQQGLTTGAARLEEEVDSLKQEVRRWKENADAGRAKYDAASEAEKRATARADELTVVVRDLRSRLETTEATLLVTRDHLMATETKLDLIEAALNLLDQRTRDRLEPVR